MPFVNDQTAVEWPEDGSDLPPPRADQFVYISPEFGGARGPVHFSIVAITAAAELRQPEGLQPQAPTAPQGRSLWDRLLGRPQQQKSSYEEERRRREKVHEQRRQQLFAITMTFFESSSRSRLLVKRDLFRKPLHTFRDHALVLI